MKSEKDIFDLILDVAERDERIRAVFLQGSRANPKIKKDKYQDYDILYYVDDIRFFYDNDLWIEENFTKPVLMQKPELMNIPGLAPLRDGHFTYLMLFDEGYRIDLSIYTGFYEDTQEPSLVLLDKDGRYAKQYGNPDVYTITRPSHELFHDVCNEFWWCLNNVVKGIARDELPYALNMYYSAVLPMLDYLVTWTIAMNHDFSVSSGKMGKHYKELLPESVYEAYLACFKDAKQIKEAMKQACDLFASLAERLACGLGFTYHINEEIALRCYIEKLLSE